MRPKLLSIVLATWTATIAVPALAAAKAPAVIRIAAVGQFARGKVVSSSLVGIADARGYLREAFAGTPTRIDVKFFTNGGPAINEAIAANNLQVAESGGVPLVVARAGAIPTHLIMAGRERGNYYVAVKAGPRGAAFHSIRISAASASPCISPPTRIRRWCASSRPTGFRSAM